VKSKTVTDAIDWLKKSDVTVVLSPGRETYYSFGENKMVVGMGGGGEAGIGASLAHETYHSQFIDQEVSPPRSVSEATFVDQVVDHEIRAATKAVDATRELRAAGQDPEICPATQVFDRAYSRAAAGYRQSHPNASSADVDREAYTRGINAMSQAYRDGTLRESNGGLTYGEHASQAWRTAQREAR
jgi:hypothetical protein